MSTCGRINKSKRRFAGVCRVASGTDETAKEEKER